MKTSAQGGNWENIKSETEANATRTPLLLLSSTLASTPSHLPTLSSQQKCLSGPPLLTRLQTKKHVDFLAVLA